MEDRFNTIAGWALFAGIVALGLSSVSGKYFKADKPRAPETAGYVVEGVISSEGGEAEIPIETFLASADLARGESVYKKCLACHTINPGGADGIGPNLYGIMGAPIGKHSPGFAYSSVLANHGGIWDWANMDAWLLSPRNFASGTKMSFAGLSKPEDRANVMAWMNAQGSNLPIPAAPAAPAAEEAAAPAQGDAAAAAAAPADAAAAPVAAAAPAQ